MDFETIDTIRRFYATHHPFDTLAAERLATLADHTAVVSVGEGDKVYAAGERLEGVYAIADGAVEIATPAGDVISRLETGECFGERGLFLDGRAPYTATAAAPTVCYRLAPTEFLALVEGEAAFARFFGREASAAPGPAEAIPEVRLAVDRIGHIMSGSPVTVGPDEPVSRAAELIRDRGISCVLVTDTEAERLLGVLTTGDLCGRVLAAGLPPETPVRSVMTTDPVALPVEAVALDAVVTMAERGIGHLPVVEGDRPVGIVTRTNLLLQQALSAPAILAEIARKDDVADLARSVAKVPAFLAQLVGSGAAPHVIGRMVTDVTDALTRRLIALAEARLGPPPVPYLWAVCGSQGRQEQTGVSDQDNCLILDDAATEADDAWFEALAAEVTAGLDACGFYYCPGEMMASNPRWRQPLRVWRDYFEGWIRKPDPMARMLASVMFDLRPVAGDPALLEDLQAETLERSRTNSIFIAHMVANSLTHQPPLGLFRGFALIRSGEHKDSLDLKHNGVVPVVDLGRLYALMGGLAPVNTRARLVAAREAGIVSETGGQDLIDAFDLISEARLRHQADQIRRGEKPDNFLAPSSLSELERNHLRNAFVVVKTMQSAAAQGRHTVV